MSENQIKCTVKVTRVRWYEDNWGILEVKPIEVEYGLIEDNGRGVITIKGLMPRPNYIDTYTVIAKEVIDPQWGKQYDLLYMGTPMNLTDENEQRVFLQNILTPTQFKSLYDTLENPFEAIKNEDVKQLTSVKGIGVVIAARIIERYKDTIDYSKAYVELDKYGLTPRMIEKLVVNFGSPDVAVEKINENPYILADEVDGIGFAKADAIALKSGIDPFSVKRIRAFIIFYLEQQAYQGYSWLTPNALMSAIITMLGNIPKEVINETIYYMKDKKELYWNNERTFICLRKYFEMEQEVAQELLRLHNHHNRFNYHDWEQTIKETEKQQGWEYTEQQFNGIKTVLENQVTIITGYGGCVDADTEYFNGYEWKRIADYKKGDLVLQYHLDGKATLVDPLGYIKKKENKMTLIKNKLGSVNQCLSDEHNVVYVTSKGNLLKKPLTEVIKIHDSNPRGFGGKFITTFDYQGEGINLTNEEIKVMIAVIADGSFYNNDKECHINIKKQRKKERLELLLKEANIPYKSYTSDIGYNRYKFIAPLQQKEFEAYWYNCNKQQLQIIADEVLNWDGSLSNNRKRFSTTSKKTADFVQFVFSSLGYRTTISERNRVGQKHSNKSNYIRKSLEYELHISKGSKLVGIRSKNPEEKLKLQTIIPKDGYKYCFTVPTNMLILRREGRIFITGNTGKTSIVAGMLDVLSTYGFAQCALSGKAASRLTEVTGAEGFTIHRLLGYENGRFIRCENLPLEQDIIIVDELSMVGGHLFLSLLKAIDNGAKLIMICDIGQLESIGVANIAKDIIDSGIIPVVNLTQIHRQAEKSAIVTESLKIRKGIQIFDSLFYGTEIRGELQDLELDIYDDKAYTARKVISHFKEKLQWVDNILDIQVIVPVKTRGDACTFKLNKELQNIYNPYNPSKKEIKIKLAKDMKYILREGDKVIDTKNNYKTINIAGEITPIFNGNVGIIESIDLDNNIIIIDFQYVGKIIIQKKNWMNIELAYAMTVHKSQGSEFKIVIGAVDYTAYTLLNKELIYTLITRAKKYCVLIAESHALRHAIAQSNVSTKQTFLKFFLCDELQDEWAVPESA